MTFTRYLIVRADGVCRVVQRYHKLNFNQVAFRLQITVPPMWGTQAGLIELTIPEGEVSVDVPETLTPEAEQEPSRG